jgi:excisionase family DNA binding protein
MAEDKLFSVRAAAEWLGGVSVWTIRSWLSQGRLRRVKIGSRTMIRRSELEKLIDDGEVSRDQQPNPPVSKVPAGGA